MKIKRLIIRNIASIETGDIDFENGLIDHETGKPASLFLITGDTGSGKSVILDCISMSLYATTPRVKSVNGIKNNIYRNNDGEEISVNDITQYTRIGISAKDDCYSELSFTGNDGIDYVAKFALGMTTHRNHRKPEWTLKIGETEIIENRKEEIKERIEQAVGLSFEQFSRMAMLAQGQFATFLTGKKEERERILEQLTATDIFSRYGEAISSLYKTSKQELDTSKKIYEEFSKKILDDSKREELLTEQSEKKEAASKCQAESNLLRQRINATDAIIKAEKEIKTLKEENAKLKELEDSPEFRKRSTLISLWDSTSEQRDFLSDKNKAIEKLTTDKKALQKKKSDFLLLCDDLQLRIEEVEYKSKILDKRKIWIESKDKLKKLFTDAPAVISSINRYVATGKDLILKENEIETFNSSITILDKRVAESTEQVKLNSDHQAECQSKIDKKTSEREALKPSAIRKENEKMLERQYQLSYLSGLLDSLESEEKEAEKEVSAIADLSNLLSSLSSDVVKASAETDRFEKEKIASENRYNTMLLSTNEKFEAIRKQLVEEHAKYCPLCGQSIQDHLQEWGSKDYFSSILAPLEEEKIKCREKYSASKKKTDTAINKMNQTAGILKAKEDGLNSRKKNISKIREDVMSKIKTLGLKTSDSLQKDVTENLQMLKSKIEETSEKLKQAETLQTEITISLKEKDEIDKQLKDAEKKLQDAKETLNNKKLAIKLAKERIKELGNENKSIRNEISIALKDYAEDWNNNPEEIALSLKKDAEDYSSSVASYAKEAPALNSLLKILESIKTIKESLSKILSSVSAMEKDMSTDDIKSLSTEEYQERWHIFHIEVSAIYARIADNETKIREADIKLNEYYQANGISETTLTQLLKAAKEISEMRRLQDLHRDKASKNATLLAEAKKVKEKNLQLLKLQSVDELEDLEKLNKELNSLISRGNELSLRLGAIKERLNSDEKTRLESEKQRLEVESKTQRMYKWEKMNKYFGGTRFRTLVQSHILRPLLHNANIYLRQITDHYTLTCSDENEQLSILVLDRYHNNEPRSVTVLSGGERFMVSLALSLALSAMNRPDMNVDILFIDEGFGTLDAKSLDMVMSTLRRLPEINGQTGRRVGVISHREELTEQIDTQIQLRSYGEGRSRIIIH